MSGGVDSSTAAHLLLEQGHEVIGAFMRHGEQAAEACSLDGTTESSPLLPILEQRKDHKQGCCSAADAEDARKVADRLNIPFYALNLEEEFREIIDYFVPQRIDRPWVFGRALLLAGVTLLLATSIDVTGIVIVLLGLVGAAVGVVYILGFTIIQETTDDELRGRVFAAFYSVARVGVLLIVVAAPALTVLFDRITELTTDGTVNVFGYRLLIPGVRITFWLAALIIVGAGTFAMRTLRGVTTGPADPGLRSVS